MTKLSEMNRVTFGVEERKAYQNLVDKGLANMPLKRFAVQAFWNEIKRLEASQ